MVRKSTTEFKKVESWAFECLRCDYKWVPRGTGYVYGPTPPEPPEKRPRICPKCKSAYWDTPKG